jgi:hypothetical protein
VSAGDVVRVRGVQKFDTGAHYAEVSCKHQDHGACGGCYARLFFAMLEIQQRPASSALITVRVFREMKADKR